MSKSNLAKPKKAKSLDAVALHLKKESTHAVGIGNIRVVLFKDKGAWIAQGLDIDYAAYGPTKTAAKKNFEEGLEGTIDLHIKVHSTIENLLKVAPPEIWKAIYEIAKSTEYRYTQVTFHDDLFKEFPYQGIDFLEPQGAAA